MKKTDEISEKITATSASAAAFSLFLAAMASLLSCFGRDYMELIHMNRIIV